MHLSNAWNKPAPRLRRGAKPHEAAEKRRAEARRLERLRSVKPAVATRASSTALRRVDESRRGIIQHGDASLRDPLAEERSKAERKRRESAARARARRDAAAAAAAAQRKRTTLRQERTRARGAASAAVELPAQPAHHTTSAPTLGGGAAARGPAKAAVAPLQRTGGADRGAGPSAPSSADDRGVVGGASLPGDRAGKHTRSGTAMAQRRDSLRREREEAEAMLAGLRGDGGQDLWSASRGSGSVRSGASTGSGDHGGSAWTAHTARQGAPRPEVPFLALRHRGGGGSGTDDAGQTACTSATTNSPGREAAAGPASSQSRWNVSTRSSGSEDRSRWPLSWRRLADSSAKKRESRRSRAGVQGEASAEEGAVRAALEVGGGGGEGGGGKKKEEEEEEEGDEEEYSMSSFEEDEENEDEGEESGRGGGGDAAGGSAARRPSPLTTPSRRGVTTPGEQRGRTAARGSPLRTPRRSPLRTPKGPSASPARASREAPGAEASPQREACRSPIALRSPPRPEHRAASPIAPGASSSPLQPADGAGEAVQAAGGGVRTSYFRLDARPDDGWGLADPGDATYSADLEWEESEDGAWLPREGHAVPTGAVEGSGGGGDGDDYFSDELHLSVDMEGPAGGEVDAMDVIKEADHEEGTPFAS